MFQFMLHFRSNDSATTNPNLTYIYIPLYLDWRELDKTPLLPLFALLLEFEVVVLFISATVTSVLIYKVYNTSLLHINVKCIYLTHLSEFYFFVGAQLILMCYQVGWIWTGFDQSDDLLLLVCGFIKMQRMWATVIVVPVAVAERLFATLIIEKYERHKSRRVAICLCIFKIVVSIHMTIRVLAMHIPYWYIFAIVIFALGASVLVLIYLIAVNHKRLAHLEHVKCSKMYNLSKRYQLMENERVFKITRTFIFTVILNILLVWATLTIVREIADSRYQPYAVLCMEYIVCSTPILIAISLRLFVKKSYSEQTPIMISRTISRFEMVEKNQHDEDTEVYFKNLDKQWK